MRGWVLKVQVDTLRVRAVQGGRGARGLTWRLSIKNLLSMYLSICYLSINYPPSVYQLCICQSSALSIEMVHNWGSFNPQETLGDVRGHVCLSQQGRRSC